ncbi:MAG: DUF1549 domain-containing protein, partial [Planctomycetales bacterium]|nr:DUF1549 domain-containing protein [Planctomycetales bacterium]
VLSGRDARWQLQVTLEHSSGDGRRASRDVTRQVTYRVEPAEVAQVDDSGFLIPLASGRAKIVASLPQQSQTATVRLVVEGMETLQPVHFANQVVPIFTKLGCNGGGCHGKAAGQAGFKLSLLGFEPQEDYQHLVLESRGRRLFPALPGHSLLLQKAVNQSPHGGGKRLEVDSHEYRLMQRWIAGGAPYGSATAPVVTAIEVVPAQRQLQPEAQQQLAVRATYSDGSVEDITRTVQYEANNTDLAQVSEQGLVTLGKHPGDVAVMARYQGQVAVFMASIPLGVQVAQWPPTRNLVDELVFAKLKTLGIPPSAVSDDANFLRRLTLDLCGRLPTIEETQAFVADTQPTKVETTVERLLSSSGHAEYFAQKWSNILRNRRTSAGQQLGTFAFHDWLRSSFYDNKPYDQLVRELLTASGSVASNPPVAWLREVTSTEARVEDTAQLFLGQRIQCARCHHHPFEKWSQADYYRLSAFFSQVAKKAGPTPDEPRFVTKIAAATAQHPKSGEALSPAGLGAEPASIAVTEDARESLVDWMVAADNPYFARSLVNRYWKHFFAVGLVEPEDDMRATNPPTNPQLLDQLAEAFVHSGYDQRALLRLICTSTVYRLSSDPNAHNLHDHSYARFYPKRLSAEVLLDAVDQVLMTHTAFEGMPPETRAVSLPDAGFQSYFLDVFGKPAGTTACECERSQEATLAQSLHLINSKEVQAKLSSDSSLPASLAASSDPVEQKIEQLYLAALSRLPTADELQAASEYLARKADQPRPAYEDLVWAILNSKEFIFNH